MAHLFPYLWLLFYRTYYNAPDNSHEDKLSSQSCRQSTWCRSI